MNNNYSCSVQDLFELFNDSLNPSDVLHAKLMSQISSAIIKERIKLHMTQSQFADFIDVKQSLISRWEQGTYNFSLRKLSEIAIKLKLDVNLVFLNVSEFKSSDSFNGSLYSTKIVRYSAPEKGNMKSGKYDNSSFSTMIKIANKEETKDYVTIC